MKILRKLYTPILAALRRLGLLERERLVRADLEEFLRRLPLPTILLRWNLTLIYQNRAARDFCAIWERGWRQARLIKTASPVPCEILDKCRQLKRRWSLAQQARASDTSFGPEAVSHPQLPRLRATIRIKQSGSAALVRPHFLIESEEITQRSGPQRVRCNLFHLARLTNCQREIAQLVCEGQSNKQIADSVHVSLAMVKKHLHATFRKLEVASRSQLVALML